MSINKPAKPFLKWAGGKTQLLNDISHALPSNLIKKKFTYIEPFVGSGAVLFWILNSPFNLHKVIINDVNEDLINAYKAIKKYPKKLISILKTFEGEFHSLENDPEKKKEYYYDKRTSFNLRSEHKIVQAAIFIFLNRTCFNGLFRTNRKNEFNVPIGSYKKPMICDEQNLLTVSKLLQDVEILCGDFENTFDYATNNTLFYCDPPYKPLNKTSSFNSYSKNDFSDDEQIRLRNFCSKLDSHGYSWILSNSDVKGVNIKNNFFDDLYANFKIERVDARRNINSNGAKRGKLKELLITNCTYEKSFQLA